jgi:(p)ppGpp synthase/HD superfamily hydrolase
MTRVEQLRGYLINNAYWMAVEAMEFASRFHQGYRRNGDDEFSHPVEVALQLVESDTPMEYPEETITAALLHDLCEDYDIPFDAILVRFGPQVEKAVRALTKAHKGMTYSFNAKMMEAARCPIASLVKASDRLHNVETMEGAFSTKKASSYIDETEVQVLPHLELAMQFHPEQSDGISFFLSKIRSAVADHLVNSTYATAAE